MKKSIKYIAAVALCVTLTQCSKNFLEPTNPGVLDDDFVTSTTKETFKTLSWCYANYRQNGIMGTYRWNDPIGSDAEAYCEDGSSNNVSAILRPDLITIDAMSGGYSALYATLARGAKVAQIISTKPEYLADVAAGRTSDWTQLYGEALTIRAFCYFELTKHFGDVPYGYENTTVQDYTLTSRFTIYDNLIASLQKAEPLMYTLGTGSITAERFSRTFADALIGEIALYSGGYQTIRTDVAGLYGSVAFTTKGNTANGCVYARRNDYRTYEKTAETWLQKAIDNKGSAVLITADTRATSNNPFQRHFQYFNDLQVSPESLFEVGNIQGGAALTTSEYSYAFGRPSDGGSANSAPNKTFGALRIIPTVFYGEYLNADKRRDASVAVTGSNGDGNEKMLNFVPGSKTSGGIATNKWDDNKMANPYVAAQRASGTNWPVMRMADVILMLAMAKAEQDETDAITLVNQIRARAFGSTKYNYGALSGQPLRDAVYQERKLELLGEGTRRWDMVLSGTFSERAIAVQQEMTTMVNDLKAQGYHTFANGNVISSYIYVKKVALTNPLTYDTPAADTLNNPATPVLNTATYPGWRGQFNYSSLATVASKVVGTTHNLSIQGLFRYINPASAEATALVAAGYVKTNWGIDIVNNFPAYQRNILSGITSAGDPPRYYWAIPSTTIAQSNGKVKNGYGLPNQ